MGAASPPQLNSSLLESSEIHDRLKDFLDAGGNDPLRDIDGDDPNESFHRAPAIGKIDQRLKGIEKKLRVSEEGTLHEPAAVDAEGAEEIADTLGDEEGDEEVEEGEEVVLPGAGEEEDRGGITTLADMAREFDLKEEDLLHHLEVDGPTGRVSLFEALAQFRNAPESARRWNEIAQAEQRLSQVDQQMQARNNEMASQLAAHTQAAIDVITEEFRDIDWRELEVEDPTRYLILKGRQEAQHRKVAGAVDTLKALQAQRESDSAASVGLDRNRELSLLRQKMPDWQDEKKASTAITEVRNFLTKSGFAPEEMDSLQDHRLLLVAYQAAKFNQLQQEAPNTIEKLRRLPPTRRTLKAGARREGDRTAEQKVHSQRVSSLKRTGTERAAAALIEGHL